MTLNGLIALILRFSSNLVALLAGYISVDECRPMSVNIVSQFSLLLLTVANLPCSAVSL